MERHVFRRLCRTVFATSILLTFLAGMAAMPMAAAQPPKDHLPILSPARAEANRVLLERLRTEPEFADQVGIVGREYALEEPNQTGTFYMQFVAWAFADASDARTLTSALLTNLESGLILADATEVDGPSFADESALFTGEADEEGTPFNVAFLVVRDGVTVGLWTAAGFDDDQTEVLIDAADDRWGDVAESAGFEPGADPEAAMLDLLPDGADLPDGFNLVAEAAILMVEPTPSKFDQLPFTGHIALATD